MRSKTNEDTSGASSSATEAEERGLRQALYKPQASARDVERYQHHLVAESTTEQILTAEASDARAKAGDAVMPSRAATLGKRLPVLAGAVFIVVATIFWISMAGTGRPPITVVGEHQQPSTVNSSTSASHSVDATPAAHDSGSRQFATGPVSGTRSGAFRYTIASGDTELGIAARFHVCTSDVTGGLPLAMQGNSLKPGTTISLELGTTSIWPDNTVHCTDS